MPGNDGSTKPQQVIEAVGEKIEDILTLRQPGGQRSRQLYKMPHIDFMASAERYDLL